MAEFKHLVVAKFKDGVDVEELLKGMKKLVSDIDHVLSFEWGEDLESLEMLRQGFTHAFMMTFKTKADFNAFNNHPKHVEFSATFAAVIDKFVVLDFTTALIKPPQVPPQAPPPEPKLENNETSNKTSDIIEAEETSNKTTDNVEAEETSIKTTEKSEGEETLEKAPNGLENQEAAT